MVGELALCDYVGIYQATSQSLSLLSCTSWREWGCLPELEGLAEVVDVSHVRYSAQGERQLETVLSMRGGGGGWGGADPAPALHRALPSFTGSAPGVPRLWCAWTIHLLNNNKKLPFRNKGGGDHNQLSSPRQHSQTLFVSPDIMCPASIPSPHGAEISFKERHLLSPPGRRLIGLRGPRLLGVPWQ